MLSKEQVDKIIGDYDFIDVAPGNILIKKFQDKADTKGALKRTGSFEDKPYAFVIRVSEDQSKSKLLLEPGDLVLYDEFEGQELEKIPKILKEDGLIIIPNSSILARLNSNKK